jgi:HEAT repeat protein
MVLICASCSKGASKGSVQADTQATTADNEHPLLKASKKTPGVLSRYEALINEQEEARHEDEERQQIEAQDRAVQLAISQSLDELLTLDPDKDARRVKQITKDLVGIGDKAFEAVRTMLSEDRPTRDKILLLGVLGSFKRQDVGDELYKYALSKDVKLREAALTKLKDAPVREDIVSKALDNVSQVASPDKPISNDEKLSNIAVIALGGDRSIDKLTDIIRTSDNPELKKGAIDALGQIGTDSAKSALYDALANGDDNMKVLAAQALGKQKQEDIVTRFGEILIDQESTPGMRLAAVEGLGADNSGLARALLYSLLKDVKQPMEVHQSAVNALLRGQGKDTVPREVAIAYVNLFGTTPIEYLPQMLQPLVATGGDAAADMLASRYLDFNQLKRIHTIRTIGRIHTDHAFEILFNTIYQEKDAGLRQEILTSMKSFTGERFTTAMTPVLRWMVASSENKQERLTALRYLGDLAPSEAASLAEQQLTSQDKDAIITSIDIIKKRGDSKDKNILLSFKLMDATGEYGTLVDDAVTAIEARENK